MKWIIATLSALSLLIILAACNGDGDDSATPSPTATATLTPQASPTVTTSPAPTQAPNVCLPNPDPATPEFQTIDQPIPADRVASPLTVTGEVLAFEGTFQVAIYDAGGSPIAETFGTSQATQMGELGSFTIDVEFEVDEETPACLWVYEESARDGSPIHVGQVPVVLLPASAASPTPTPAFQGTRGPVVRVGGPPAAQLVAVRTGLHDGFDRTVFEFQVGLPGYRIEYGIPPIVADGSGLPVDIEGTAFIRASFEPAAGYDPSTGDMTYDGPLEIASDLLALVELERTGDFEGQLNWVLGLSEMVDFRVIELEAPFRVVIDVKHP